MHKHLAIKLTYNDGDEGSLVGFNGTCSDEMIKSNVKNHAWCGNNENECWKYVSNGLTGLRPNLPCYESRLFNEWKYGAGYYLTGPYAGEPKRAIVTKGGIAILTTRFPDETESERKIIGVMKIKNVQNKPENETYLIGVLTP